MMYLKLSLALTTCGRRGPLKHLLFVSIFLLLIIMVHLDNEYLHSPAYLICNGLESPRETFYLDLITDLRFP